MGISNITAAKFLVVPINGTATYVFKKLNLIKANYNYQL